MRGGQSVFKKNYDNLFKDKYFIEYLSNITPMYNNV